MFDVYPPPPHKSLSLHCSYLIYDHLAFVDCQLFVFVDIFTFSFHLIPIIQIYSISENRTAFHKTQQHVRKHNNLTEHTTFSKTQHFLKLNNISQNTTTFPKTQHFTKHNKISQNTTFPKTQQHFPKHNISQNTTTFYKTHNFTKHISQNTTC